MSVLQIPNTPFKKANELLIDKRIASYHYNYDMASMCTYMFNRDLTCSYISSLKNFKGVKTISQVFPKDTQSFMYNLLEMTLMKSQMYHVSLNKRHVLFSTHAFYDHNNIIIGIIMHEIPFTNVQNLCDVQDKTEFSSPVHFVIAENGHIHAMETVKWEVLVDSFLGAFLKFDGLRFLFLLLFFFLG
jgi:hypothetical protein